MEKIGLFFGTDTGRTRLIAKQIAKKLGDVAAAPVNIGRATLEEFLAHNALILGCPTYLMFGPAGNERYTVPPDTTFDKVSLDQSDPGHYRNYMTLAVTPTKCIATCHLEDGATVDDLVAQLPGAGHFL